MPVKVTYTMKTAELESQLGALARPEVKRTLLEAIGNHLVRSVDERFSAEKDPQGQDWTPLSRVARKRKKNPRILTESTRLRDSVVWQLRSSAVEVGTNVKYGAIHQLGGEIELPERTQDLYFRMVGRKNKRVLNRFVKKRRSNFIQTVTMGARTIHIPARPYLGVSKEDEQAFTDLLQDVIESVLSQ